MRVVVVGYGHADHGEDAAGLLVVEAIRQAAVPNIEVRAVTGDAMRAIEAWECCEFAIVVDAVDTGRIPGTIFRSAGANAVEDALAMLTSPNTLGLREAFERGPLLGRMPAHVVFYGIEAHDCSPGAPVGPAVLSAIDTVSRRILDDLSRPWHANAAGPL